MYPFGSHPFGLSPGTVVATFVRVFGTDWVHFGVISDGYIDGEPAVLNHSRRRTTVVEEPLSAFHAGRGWWVERLASKRPIHEVIAAARRERGRIRWSIWSNCEHAIRRWHGLPEWSPQLRSALAKGGLAALGIGVLTRLR